MKKLLLIYCYTFSLVFLLPGCSIKKQPQRIVNPSQTPVQNKNSNENQSAPTIASATQATTTQSSSSPAAAAAIQSFSPQKKSVAVQSNIKDVTTQPGFLGKKDEKAKATTIAKFAQELDKNPGHTTTYHHIKFDIQNVSGSKLYTTCFAYVKPRRFNRWRWKKTDIKEIKPNETISIDLRVLKDEKDLKHIFGALGVFTNYTEAEESTYELLHDENKLDLDVLSDLQNKRVVIGIERYGLREPFYDYDFIDPASNKSVTASTDLDFFVQNQTGNTVFVTGFIYTKKAKSRWIAAEDEKDDMSVWRYYKTKVLKLEQGQTGYIEVDNVVPKRDRTFVRGYLGVFNAENEDAAHRKTFELLAEKEKLNLGLLIERRGRTIILEVERYGVANDIIDYTVKPIKWIDFTKIIK